MISPANAKIFRLALSLAISLTPGFAASPSEWLTWGYDQERTGWNQAETTLAPGNVAQLELKWKAQLPSPSSEVVLSTLTAPLVATVNTPQGPRSRVFVVGSDNTVYSIDSETGKVTWQRRFPNPLTSKQPATWLCSNTQNATPVIDKDSGTIYVSTSDGKLRGLNLADGEDRMPPADFTTPFARNWSLNLVDGIIYSSTARGCGGSMAHFTALDLKDPSKRTVEFFTSTGRPAGAWGRGGMVRGPKGMYTQTADGPNDPAAGFFGNTVMFLNFKDLHLMDSYTPANWEHLNAKDLDLGSASPVVFPFQKWTLVASAAKESAIALLDADHLGGVDHHTPLYLSPRWGNDEVLLGWPGSMGGHGHLAGFAGPPMAACCRCGGRLLKRLRSFSTPMGTRSREASWPSKFAWIRIKARPRWFPRGCRAICTCLTRQWWRMELFTPSRPERTPSRAEARLRRPAVRQSPTRFCMLSMARQGSSYIPATSSSTVGRISASRW